MTNRRHRRALVATVTTAVAATAIAATLAAPASARPAPPADKHAATPTAACGDLQPVAQPRYRGRARRRPVAPATMSRPRRSPRSSSGRTPTSCCSTSSTTCRTTWRWTSSATTTSPCPRTARTRWSTRTLRRAVQHRHPQRLRPEQRRKRSAVPMTPSASASSRASTAWWCSRSTRSRRKRSAPSRRSSGRTCPEPSCPTTSPLPAAGRLVHARGARGRAPVEQVALGHPGARSGSTTLHVLASHPTPPTFDGPEDRNGRRNHDEIRFWADYISPGQSGYIVDDEGRSGGIDSRCTRS